jgi:hypothetical protein
MAFSRTLDNALARPWLNALSTINMTLGSGPAIGTIEAKAKSMHWAAVNN